jgi:hypothetical protein
MSKEGNSPSRNGVENDLRTFVEQQTQFFQQQQHMQQQMFSHQTQMLQ